MTWTNGVHPYNGKYNDRSKRQRSKIVKGMKRVAHIKHFKMIEWERMCPSYKPFFNRKSNYICDNCKNFKCNSKL